MLKTVAQAISNFWMNLFLLPNEVCDGIEKQMNRFWWGNGAENKDIRWMIWDKICVVNEGGGLGFKKTKRFQYCHAC